MITKYFTKKYNGDTKIVDTWNVEENLELVDVKEAQMQPLFIELSVLPTQFSTTTLWNGKLHLCTGRKYGPFIHFCF